MKKIPTLFKREFDNHSVVRTLPEVTEGMEWVLEGDGVATVKWDGSCCAIIDGVLYKRYDAKRGKRPPAGAIACYDPDPTTGHWPHWVKVDSERPSDKWFVEAFRIANMIGLGDGTYEAIGVHFQGNPYNIGYDTLVKHGAEHIKDFDRSFEGIRAFLESHNIEGIVFWKDGEPQCKIKRSDFGFEWPVKRSESC